MKLGVSYNVFDGEELLEASIKYIRASVDYISVVYQEVSNFGDKCSDKLIPLLNRLLVEKKIDEIYLYTPTVNNDLTARNQDQEVEKRNIGLRLSRDNGCTHYMSMDVDEFYKPEQFDSMKRIMEQGNFEAGACKHVQYYKDSIYILDPKEEEYVSTINKINNDTKFVFEQQYPVPIDPTRKTNNKNLRVFDRSEIEMHHMSMVRNDLRKKYTNHSGRKDIHQFIERVVEYYQTWKYPAPVMWAGGNLINVVEVPRYFDLGLNNG